MLTVTLVAAALVAGLIGTWSPCGFSMIETICARRRTVISCAAFALGTVAGGVATFGLAAAVGGVVHRLGGIGILAPIAAVAAALAEARGVAIAPQIRGQVPEHWRRVLPPPVAAAFYGVLLGLAFTTFVLSFAVWALAVITFALGRVDLGLAVGVAFGVGRALPVVVLAPLAHRPVGVRALDEMAQRPSLLRALRLADAAALILFAAAIVVTHAAAATRLGAGTDPSASGDVVAWTTPAGGVEIHEGQPGTTSVPMHAVVGGSLIASRDGDEVHVARLDDLAPVLDVTVPGVDALAVSDEWLVTRAPSPAGGDLLTSRPIAAPEDAVTVVSVSPPTQIGRPVLDGDLLVYHVATPHGSRIVEHDLASSTSHVLRRSRSALLTNPALLGARLLYVRQTDLAQLLELGPLAATGRDRVLYRLAAPAPHDAGHEPGYSHETRTPHPATSNWTLWTTALSSARAYVTLLPRNRSPAGARIVSVAR